MSETTGASRLPESARFLEDDLSIEVPLKVLAPSQYQIAVVAHIFHPSVTPRIRRLIDNIDGFQKLFVSTTSSSSKAEIEGYLNEAERIDYQITVTENRGRDLPSKTTLFNQAISSFDLVLFLHSKKSNHHELLGTWCDYLFETLAGDAATVDSIKTLFSLSPRLGLVAPQHYELMRQFVNWGHDFSATQTLLKKIGTHIRLDHPNDFPSGMMFWVRPQALSALHHLNIAMQDYPPENGEKDGTLAHAVEHSMFYFCEAAGYQWLKIANPAYCPNTPAILSSNTRDDLIQNLQKANYSLTQKCPRYAIRTPLSEHVTHVPAALMAKILKHEPNL